METILVFALLIMIALVAYLAFLQMKNNRSGNENDIMKILMDSVKSDRTDLTSRLERMDEKLTSNLEHSSKTIQSQFIQHKEIIKEVATELTHLKETNKQVLNFSEKLQNLENILNNPKKRGLLGEFFLETLLSNILPPELYKLQYAFKNEEIVDAVIYFQEKIIPIDSKFSLEKFNMIEMENDKKIRAELIKKFNQDVKLRIDETAKYIRPEENTTEFAFMFIPAEGVYYNLLNYNSGTEVSASTDLIVYAFKKHVIIVSPISFYAYLETVLQGLKSIKIEASVKEILSKIMLLSKDIDAYEEVFSKLGKQLETTVNTYNKASVKYKKIDKDIFKISEGEKGGELSPHLIEEHTGEN